MRSIIHNKTSHIFIEGPLQFKPVNESLQEVSIEKAAHHADFAQGYEVSGKEDAKGLDIFQPYDENERYD